MQKELPSQSIKYNKLIFTTAAFFAASTISLDWYIHHGGVSDPVHRAQIPEFIRDYLGNSFPAGVLMIPFLGAYAVLKQSENKFCRNAAREVLKIAVAIAIVMEYDIEKVTASTVKNPEFYQDAGMGIMTALSTTVAGKNIADMFLVHPNIVNFGNTDRLFDQPSLFRASIPQSVDEIFASNK